MIGLVGYAGFATGLFTVYSVGHSQQPGTEALWYVLVGVLFLGMAVAQYASRRSSRWFAVTLGAGGVLMLAIAVVVLVRPAMRGPYCRGGALPLVSAGLLLAAALLTIVTSSKKTP